MSWAISVRRKLPQKDKISLSINDNVKDKLIKFLDENTDMNKLKKKVETEKEKETQRQKLKFPAPIVVPEYIKKQREERAKRAQS